MNRAVRIARWQDGWGYIIRTGEDRYRSPLRFVESSDALTAGENDAAAYLAADRRIRR